MIFLLIILSAIFIVVALVSWIMIPALEGPSQQTAKYLVAVFAVLALLSAIGGLYTPSDVVPPRG